MKNELSMDRIAELCGADSASFIESIQSLWSGYGEIIRVRLSPQNETVVVKFVSPPSDRNHKYGWAGNVSHQRKLSSYANEHLWYEATAKDTIVGCTMARLIASEADDQGWLFVLEDLDAAGFPVRTNRISSRQLRECLKWLANLHAHFLSDSDSYAEKLGLWPIGTYWHLATRPDEFNAMPASELKSAAASIDERLNQARFKTIVHGDAKLANFCFSESGSVAAVDFQYVGGGCGMKDFAYFVSSCFSDEECERRESEMLELYFGFLRSAIADNALADEVEAEWRLLYPFAWADFHRFLAGWSPGHWKIHRYSKRMTQIVLQSL